MSVFNSGLVLAIMAASTAAAPADALTKRASCNYTGPVNVAKIASDLPTCTTVTFNAITVPAGQTLDLSGLAAKTTVTFQGTSTWQPQKGFAGFLLNIGGTDITVNGAPGAILDGVGGKYWDGLGSNGDVPKPKFLAAHKLLGSSSINNLYLKNTPVQAVSINECNGLTTTKMTIDNKDGNSLPQNQAPHNTDGFDIGDSSNITIDGATVDNQDDCVAVNSGTGIIFRNGQCNGGHGLSIGSVGHGSASVSGSNTVSNVQFLNSQVSNSANGIRVKSFPDGKGTISGVTFKGITLSQITKFGILIEQNYNGGDLPKNVLPGAGVPITGLTLDTITGTNAVISTGTNVAIACASCSGWTWTGVSVSGGTRFPCIGAPSQVPAGVCAPPSN